MGRSKANQCHPLKASACGEHHVKLATSAGQVAPAGPSELCMCSRGQAEEQQEREEGEEEEEEQDASAGSASTSAARPLHTQQRQRQRSQHPTQQQGQQQGRPLQAPATRRSARHQAWLTSQLPPELFPKVASHLDPQSLLSLFQACHATRQLVLSSAHHVRLQPRCPLRRLPALGRLLQLPEQDTGCTISNLQVAFRPQHCEAQAVALVPALQQGRVRELALKAVHMASAEQAAVLVSACSNLRSLSFDGLKVSDPSFFPALASACTRLTHLSLCRIAFTSDDARSSFLSLASGLPCLISFEVAAIPQADWLLLTVGEGRDKPVMARVTALDTTLDVLRPAVEDEVWVWLVGREATWDLAKENERLDAQLMAAMERVPSQPALHLPQPAPQQQEPQAGRGAAAPAESQAASALQQRQQQQQERGAHPFAALRDLTLFHRDPSLGAAEGVLSWGALRNLPSLQRLTTDWVEAGEGGAVGHMPRLRELHLSRHPEVVWETDLLKLEPLVRGLKTLRLPSALHPGMADGAPLSAQGLQRLAELLSSIEKVITWGDVFCIDTWGANPQAWGSGLSPQQVLALAPMGRLLGSVHFSGMCVHHLTCETMLAMRHALGLHVHSLVLDGYGRGFAGAIGWWDLLNIFPVLSKVTLPVLKKDWPALEGLARACLLHRRELTLVLQSELQDYTPANGCTWVKRAQAAGLRLGKLSEGLLHVQPSA